MARLVTLFFPDNDEADKFIEGLQAYGDGQPPKVNGLFAVPTKFCECPKVQNVDKRISRGANLGWWVHRDCGKPLTNSWQSPRNLLDPDKRERNPYIKPTWTFKYNPGDVPK